MQNRAKECVGRFEEVCLSRWAVWLQSRAVLELQKRQRNSRVHSLGSPSLSLPSPLFPERLFQGRPTFERNSAIVNLLQVPSIRKKTLWTKLKQTVPQLFPSCFREDLRPKLCLKFFYLFFEGSVPKHSSCVVCCTWMWCWHRCWCTGATPPVAELIEEKGDGNNLDRHLLDAHAKTSL